MHLESTSMEGESEGDCTRNESKITEFKEWKHRDAITIPQSRANSTTDMFAKESYKQTSGGPIGAGVTIAAARILMNDWGEKWGDILETANILGILDGYVDDVRQ